MSRASSIPIISAVYSDTLLEHDSDKVKECGIMLPFGVIKTIPTPPVCCVLRAGFPMRYQSGVMGKSLSDFYKFSSCCTMSKLDDSSGALSAAAVAKETLKDRVTDGKVDHLGGQV
ncbi:hypothetical protein ACOSQ3_028753 [Xanthoceras sorbifolium]